MEDVGERAKAIFEKQKACGERGHDPQWWPYVVTGKSDPLRDTVSGYCKNCSSIMTRHLNEE